MVGHDDNHNVLVIVVSPEHKSSLESANLFLEDTIPQKRDDATVYPSLNDDRDLGFQVADTTKIKNTLKDLPTTSQQTPLSTNVDPLLEALVESLNKSNSLILAQNERTKVF